MLRPQTREFIEKLSDQELFEYLCQEDYEPAATAFAKEEFDRRKPNPDQVAAFVTIANTKAQERDKHAAEAMDRPLKAMGRTLAFVAGFLPGPGVIGAVIAWVHFRQNGEVRKASELWTFFCFGLGALISLLAILFLLPVFLH